MIFTDLLQFNDVGLLILRLVIGFVFLYHALPKLKDPKGMAAGMGMESMGMMVLLLGIAELVLSINLILGIYTQLTALFLGIIMIGAIVVKKMKWNVPFTARDKTGWEFDLVILTANIAIFLGGSGSIVLLG